MQSWCLTSTETIRLIRDGEFGRYVAFTASTQSFRRAPTATVDIYAEIKSAPSAALPVLAEFGGRCRKAMLGMCNESSDQKLQGLNLSRILF